MTVLSTAIVTGGTSGIGFAAARLLLRQGYAVVLWARNGERGQAAVRLLQAERLPGTVSFQRCDVAAPQAVQEATQAFAATHPALNVLLNAAGVLLRTPLAGGQLYNVSSSIDVVLKGTIHTTTALAPYLARSGQGVIVNIGSVAGQHPFVGLGAYGAAKAGVAHFTRVAAQELFTSGVRVVCVCPGVVKTGLMSEAEFDALSAALPARRLQSVEEVAGFLIELTRPAWSSLTGAVIDLDDGLGLFPGNRPPGPPTPKVAPASQPTIQAGPEPTLTAIAPVRVGPPPATPTTDQPDPILARVVQVFQEVFGIAPEAVSLATGPEDVARWDSLGNLRLIAALEQTFRCRLDVNEIMTMMDVASIVQVLRGKVT